MEPQHVRVETLDAEVPCPYCKQTARKEGPPPGRPWPEPWDETIKDATDLIAMAFCDNPECLKCLNKDPHTLVVQEDHRGRDENREVWVRWS